MQQCIAYNMKMDGLIRLASHATVEFLQFRPKEKIILGTINNFGNVRNMERHTQLHQGIHKFF